MFNNITVNQIIAPFIYIAIAVVFYFLFKHSLRLIFRRPRAKLTERQMQRIETVRAMVTSVAKYIALVAVILATLANFGVDVSSLLAGLGIATAIIGLAFQDFGKDIIAGFSIISEAQYEVGDVIEVGNFRGKVTSVGLKTTRIKNYRGKEMIISNRNMDKVINYSVNNTLGEIEIPVELDAEPLAVEKALDQAKKNVLQMELEQIVGDIKIYGPTRIEDSALVWRMTIECMPYKQFLPQRMLRREAIEELNKAKIKIPFNQVEIHEGKHLR